MQAYKYYSSGDIWEVMQTGVHNSDRPSLSGIYFDYTTTNNLFTSIDNGHSLMGIIMHQGIGKLKQAKQDCIGAATYNYMTNNPISFEFSVDPDMSGQALYNPETGAITIRDPETLSVQALEEELFHAYQNKTIPGGTAQYLGQSGHANIEFEAKLLRDINQWVNMPSDGGGYTIIGAGYQYYLDEITANGTKFPTSYSQISTGYWIVLQDFTTNNPGYSSAQINGELRPTSLLSLINSSTCAK